MANSELFCAEFVAKVKSPASLCVPNGGAQFECTAMHCSGCADGVVRSLYAIFCAATVGKASDEDISAARVALEEMDAIDEPSISKFNPDVVSAGGCVKKQYGLEYHGGCLVDPLVQSKRVFQTVHSMKPETPIRARPAVWTDVLVHWDIPEEYNATEATVGNFVTAIRNRSGDPPTINRVPVKIEVCCSPRNPKKKWIDYKDRAGRVHRFSVPKKGGILNYAGGEKTLGVLIADDALSSGEIKTYDKVLETSAAHFAMSFVQTLVTSKVVKTDTTSVVVVMPPVSEDWSAAAASDAMTRASGEHLRALLKRKEPPSPLTCTRSSPTR